MTNKVSKDFIYVKDFADAVLASIFKNENETNNFESANKTTIKEITKLITRLTDSKSKIKIVRKQDQYDSIIKIGKDQNKFKPTLKMALD